MRPFPFCRPARRPLLASLLALVILPWVGHAQDASPSPSPTGTTVVGPVGFWKCDLPGGTFLVALRNLQSVSTHEYVVDGAARVTEVTVATASSVEARFYYLEPMAVKTTNVPAPASLQTLQQRVTDLATQRAPVEPIWEKVVKNYPTTTHAHTVEYRIETRANLEQIYQSLEQAWTTNKGVYLKTQ